MITKGQFHASINESIDLLKELSLFKGKGVKPTGRHSMESKKIAKELRHTDIYNTAINNKDYEILLVDDSLFQFSYTPDELRFEFIENPNIFFSKSEYLTLLIGKEELISLSDQEIEDLINSINDEEYEQFLNEQDINTSANIIRYDLSNLGYDPLIHSYSHIHVGLNPSFRISCSKILTPLKFVVFAIKNTYYDDWKFAVQKKPNFPLRIRDIKAQCVTLPHNRWTDQELFELYLT